MYAVEPSALDARRVYSVDVLAGEFVKRRITKSRQGLDDDAEVELMRSRAIGWVADFESRGTSGNASALGALV